MKFDTVAFFYKGVGSVIDPPPVHKKIYILQYAYCSMYLLWEHCNGYLSPDVPLGRHHG